MKRIEVSQLIHGAMDRLRAFGFKSSTLAAYERRSFLPIKVFFDERGENLYSTV